MRQRVKKVQYSARPSPRSRASVFMGAARSQQRRRRHPAASPDKPRSRLVVAEQRAVRLLLAHLAIEKLVVVEIDLDKRRTVFDAALDQGLRQRVLHVLLQGPAQRTRSVAAVGDGLFQNP